MELGEGPAIVQPRSSSLLATLTRAIAITGIPVKRAAMAMSAVAITSPSLLQGIRALGMVDMTLGGVASRHHEGSPQNHPHFRVAGLRSAGRRRTWWCLVPVRTVMLV